MAMKTTMAPTTMDKLNVSRERLPAADADLVRQFAEWQASVESRLAALEATRPRDAQDATFRRVLPDRTRALPFKAGDLLKHALVDPGLAAALMAADVNCVP
jgi:hypothetical protein